MAQFRCQAMINGETPCKNFTWGTTAYCVWHNCYFTWRGLRLLSQPLPRSAGWLLYDPDLAEKINNWQAGSWLSTSATYFWIFLFPISQTVLPIGPNANLPVLDRLINSLWYSAYITIAAMVLGKAQLAFPKLLLSLASIISVLSLVKALQALGAENSIAPVAGFVGALGLILLSLPPPKGPMRNENANVRDPEVPPPFNVGAWIMRGTGILFVIIWFIGTVIR